MDHRLDTSEAAAPGNGAAASEPRAPEAPPRPAPKRAVRRVATGVGVALAAAAALAALLYFFGGMERPTPEMRAAFDRLVAEGRVAPFEQRFVIPIPGCRCHSDDPVSQMQHSVRRVRECAGCHVR